MCCFAIPTLKPIQCYIYIKLIENEAPIGSPYHFSTKMNSNQTDDLEFIPFFFFWVKMLRRILSACKHNKKYKHSTKIECKKVNYSNDLRYHLHSKKIIFFCFKFCTFLVVYWKFLRNAEFLCVFLRYSVDWTWISLRLIGANI